VGTAVAGDSVAFKSVGPFVIGLVVGSVTLSPVGAIVTALGDDVTFSADGNELMGTSVLLFVGSAVLGIVGEIVPLVSVGAIVDGPVVGPVTFSMVGTAVEGDFD